MTVEDHGKIRIEMRVALWKNMTENLPTLPSISDSYPNCISQQFSYIENDGTRSTGGSRHCPSA
eukprot:1619213-Pyramimonas_sp.AAC.1